MADVLSNVEAVNLETNAESPAGRGLAALGAVSPLTRLVTSHNNGLYLHHVPDYVCFYDSLYSLALMGL